MQAFPGAGIEVGSVLLLFGRKSSQPLLLLYTSFHCLLTGCFSNSQLVRCCRTGVTASARYKKAWGGQPRTAHLRYGGQCSFFSLWCVCPGFIFPCYWSGKMQDLGKAEEAIDLLGIYTLKGKKINSLENQNYIGVRGPNLRQQESVLKRLFVNIVPYEHCVPPS